jgi:uncharacterized membrane protein YedE/YeeE
MSSAFTVLVAQLCRIKFFKQLIPPLGSFTYGIENNLTLLFAFGAVVGSFISTYSTNQFPLNKKYGANVWNSFVGGFILLLGARCAGGCTSGQGISGKKHFSTLNILFYFYKLFKGVTHLLIGSLLVTGSMFGGAILFAISYGLITNDWQFYAL